MPSPEEMVKTLVNMLHVSVAPAPINGTFVWSFQPRQTQDAQGLHPEWGSVYDESPPEEDEYEEAVWPPLPSRAQRERLTDGDPRDGHVYLIHFESRLTGGNNYAQHYLGWAKNLKKRLAKHKAGNGSVLMRVIAGVPIGWVLVASWPGPKSSEKWYKRQRHHHRFCPICRGEINYDDAKALEAEVIQCSTLVGSSGRDR